MARVEFAVGLVLVCLVVCSAVSAQAQASKDPFGYKELMMAQVTNEDANVEFLRRGSGRHTENWAVLVCTSRYWFNYRHIANTLALYRNVKRLGIPDSRIILMLADDMACNSRNVEPGTVYAEGRKGLDLYGDHIEVDYRGEEVTVENFIRVLTGRHKPGTPPSKRLKTSAGSNVLIYMTGHGGNEFLKFQDAEEISSRDLGDAFAQMWEKKRYNEILFMVDTCQAGTLANHLYSPNIIAVGSSQKDENSYSLGHDDYIGLSMVDRFTYVLLEQLEQISLGSQNTLLTLMKKFHPSRLMSNPQYRFDLWKHRRLPEVLVTDFFGSTVTVETGIPRYPIVGEATPEPQETISNGELKHFVSDCQNATSVAETQAVDLSQARESGTIPFVAVAVGGMFVVFVTVSLL